MKNKISCSIVRDLLPNYIDKLTEEESNAIIEEHLMECSDCKSIYEEMTREMEINRVKTETKENKVREFLNKAKLGHIMNIVFKIVKIFTLILYFVINATMVYLIYSSTKYYSITEKATASYTMQLFSYTLFIPAILLFVLFIKKDNIVLRVTKIIIQLILLIITPYIFIVGSLLSLGMPSYTTNPANYESQDINVGYLLENEDFVMLPDKLPNNIIDVDYLYKFETAWDDEYLTLNISWTYQEDEDYQNAKLKMQAYQPINKQVEEDGFQMLYAIGNKKENKQRFCFGYDDDENRVTYQIYYEW